MKRYRFATAQTDIKALDWDENTVTVAKKGDKVEVLQVFPEITFIQVKGWDFEVIVQNDQIKINTNMPNV